MTQQFKHKTSGQLYHIGKDQKQGTNLINSITGSEYFLRGYYEQKDVDELFTPVKETEPEQPYYKGKGEHSVNQLEAICSQYKEYVSFLNSRGNDTTPTSKEGLEDRGFTPGEWEASYNSEEFPGQAAIYGCDGDTNGRVIAVLDTSDQTDMANIDLICAAPIMYDLLKWVVNEIETTPDELSDALLGMIKIKCNQLFTRINKD